MSDEKTAQERAKETRDRIAGEVNKEVKSEEAQIKQGEQALAELPKDFLQNMSGVGMRNVDPMDIRPPMCLLVQKISNISEMVTAENVKPEPGQFFHTGKNEIYSL